MEEFEEIKKKVVRHPDSVDLYIKRLPKKTRDIFVEFANNEFVGDYGMALKAILEDYLIRGQQIGMLMSIAEEHESRIIELEKGKKVENPKLKGIRENIKKRMEEQTKCQD